MRPSLLPQIKGAVGAVRSRCFGLCFPVSAAQRFHCPFPGPLVAAVNAATRSTMTRTRSVTTKSRAHNYYAPNALPWFFKTEIAFRLFFIYDIFIAPNERAEVRGAGGWTSCGKRWTVRCCLLTVTTIRLMIMVTTILGWSSCWT